MIFSNISNYMLKYQKAKAKLVEYGKFLCGEHH